MDTIIWIIIIAFFIVSFIGLIYPIIPSVLFLVGGFLVYGFYFSFTELPYSFWIVEGIFVAIIFTADYLANLYGVKRRGGSKAAIWGSTIGLLIGPFILPIIGIILGPFLGAVIAELLIHRKSLNDSIRVGVGSLIGFVSGVLAKTVIQLGMIGYFIFVLLK
ncbi:DUF456 family protein [Bacillus carboniphilus]|uniref:DUF456 family protein n=1 Tax=Bacillus carboniphilus TaxID=86663 RepID=A0ABY9K2A5_9BACI|nr:DUF456 family protein [Bacillus carboniphilus]WLR43955.1 DUF456 family protein [Bacillus carboniphilus]